MLKLVLFGVTGIGTESASATRVMSIYLGQMADSLLDVTQITDLTLNVLKGWQIWRRKRYSLGIVFI